MNGADARNGGANKVRITVVNFHFDTRNTRKPITQEQYEELIRRVDKAVKGFGIVDIEIKQMVSDDYEYPEPQPRIMDSSKVCFAPFDAGILARMDET